VIDELPVGSTCEVTEAPDRFFDATYAPANTLTLGVAASENQLTITNTGNELLESEYEVPSEPLAFTGRTVTTLLSLGLYLLIAGVLFVILRNRRRERETA